MNAYLIEILPDEARAAVHDEQVRGWINKPKFIIYSPDIMTACSYAKARAHKEVSSAKLIETQDEQEAYERSGVQIL